MIAKYNGENRTTHKFYKFSTTPSNTQITRTFLYHDIHKKSLLKKLQRLSHLRKRSAPPPPKWSGSGMVPPRKQRKQPDRSPKRIDLVPTIRPQRKHESHATCRFLRQQRVTSSPSRRRSTTNRSKHIDDTQKGRNKREMEVALNRAGSERWIEMELPPEARDVFSRIQNAGA